MILYIPEPGTLGLDQAASLGVDLARASDRLISGVPKYRASCPHPDMICRPPRYLASPSESVRW
jgi:hypothetical protein